MPFIQSQSYTLSAVNPSIAPLATGSQPGVIYTSITVSNPTTTSVDVTWVSPVDDITQVPPFADRPPAVPISYQIQYRRQCDITWNFSPVLVSQLGSITYTLTGLTASTQYMIRVMNVGSLPSLPIAAATTNQTANTRDGTCVYDPQIMTKSTGGSVTPQSIIENGNTWTLLVDTNLPYLVALNGTSTGATGSECTMLFYSGGSVYFRNKSGAIWKRVGNAWTLSADPRIGANTLPAMSLPPGFSATTYAGAVMSQHDYPVLDNLQIYVIYRGPQWNAGTAGIPIATAQSLMTQSIASANFDNLTEFGITQRPVVTQIVDATLPPTTWNAAEQETFLFNAFRTNVVPYAATDATVYMMVYPITTTSSQFSDGLTATYIGRSTIIRHSAILIHAGNVNNGQTLTTQNYFTGDVCREIIDLMTDPGYGGLIGYQGLAGANATAGTNVLSEVEKISLGTGVFTGSLFYWGYYSNLNRSIITPNQAITPSQVTGLNANTGRPIGLNWTASTTGTIPITYLVQQATTATGPFTQVASTTNTSITVQPPDPIAVNYWYRIVASNGGGNAAPSTIVGPVQTLGTTGLGIVSNFVATIVNGDQAQMTWNPLPGATSYNVIFSPTSNPADGMLVTTISTNMTLTLTP